MKFKSVLSLVLIAIASFASVAEDKDPALHTVGRVRFVEGNSAVFAFKGMESHVGLDFLVLLGVAFNTNEGRVELLDLNENTYWFDRDTQFHFESYDPKGELTTLFLGKGSFICETKLPFSMITASGSMVFPGNGTYLIEKDELGKKKVKVTVLDGANPKVVKKATVFEKIKIQTESENRDLIAWQDQRIEDWDQTETRHHLFSNVSRMPPFLANTKSDGTLSWQKVGYIQPHFRASEFIEGNKFWLNPVQLHTSGMMPEMTTTWSEEQIVLWFAINRYNAIQWAWDVSNGWHAQFYYDPLVGLSAEYNSAPWASWFYQTVPIGVSFASWNRWYHRSFFDYSAAGSLYEDRRPWYPPVVQHDPREPVVGEALVGNKPLTTGIRPIQGRIRVVNGSVRLAQRHVTDRTLVSQRQLTNLDLRVSDIRRSEQNDTKYRSRAAYRSLISNRTSIASTRPARVTVPAAPVRKPSSGTTTRTRTGVRGS